MTISKLLALNRQFYQSFADSFSATRGRLQPGVLKVLDDLPPGGRLLDLGCGNGELWREMARRGFDGLYAGLDFSAGLLSEAQQGARGKLDVRLFQADLADPGWDYNLPPGPFDAILAFAVLHHLPGAQLRSRVLTRVNQLLAPAGRFILSIWQFLESPRLRARVQPWELVGLAIEDVDPGDYLLDWRRDGFGLRYVHHFTAQELADLAVQTGFHLLDAFHADGEAGKSGFYQVWAKISGR